MWWTYLKHSVVYFPNIYRMIHFHRPFQFCSVNDFISRRIYVMSFIISIDCLENMISCADDPSYALDSLKRLLSLLMVAKE